MITFSIYYFLLLGNTYKVLRWVWIQLEEAGRCLLIIFAISDFTAVCDLQESLSQAVLSECPNPQSDFCFLGLPNSHTPVRPPSTSSTGSRGRWVVFVFNGIMLLTTFFLRKISNVVNKNKLIFLYSVSTVSTLIIPSLLFFVLFSIPLSGLFETNLRNYVILLVDYSVLFRSN